MKKLIVFLLLASLLKFDLYSQHDISRSLMLYKDIVYTDRGKPILLLDIYVPGEEKLAVGIGLQSDKQKHVSTPEASKYPVLIWLPGPASDKFPTPVAEYTGNGYAVISMQYDSEPNILANISEAVDFLKFNSLKYNLDSEHIGIIQPLTNGYRAILWQAGTEKLKSLSRAGIKTEFNVPVDFKYTKLQTAEGANAILGFFDKHLRHGIHVSSDPLLISCPADSWVDPITYPVPNTTYHLFPTRVRGMNTFGSYLIYLPLDYDISNRRYPVIYWLHGGNGNSREGSWMCMKLNEAIQQGRMPQTIIVFVQGLPVGWYNNSKDGTMPVEDVIIRDLIPHIDATWRTLTSRLARGVEGMSMGGYGSLHLGFKYPELFGVVSSIAPSITTFAMERKEVIEPVFENDSLYFNTNSPAELVRKNADYIRKNTKIRLLTGDEDFLFDLIEKFHLHLNSLEIDHQYRIAKGADHDYKDVIEILGLDSFSFWREAFGSDNNP